jgi:hypothetical protein
LAISFSYTEILFVASIIRCFAPKTTAGIIIKIESVRYQTGYIDNDPENAVIDPIISMAITPVIRPYFISLDGTYIAAT